jgi:hypothetical protein
MIYLEKKDLVYNIKIHKKILEIQYLAIICKLSQYDCFTQYNAHVNTFDVRLYNGSWNRDSQSIDTSFKIDNSKHSLEKADSVIYQLKSIIKKKGIDYENLLQEERISYHYRF